MSKWKLVPVEPTQAMIDATNSVPEGAGYLSCVRAYRAMLDAAPAWQAEPVAWVRNLTDPQPHCVTGLQYRTAADADAGVQYIPVYLHPPAAEVQRLRDALTALLDHYVSLVASGDAGKWDAEQEPQVIAARRALGGE